MMSLIGTLMVSDQRTQKTVDKETALWYKHINLTGKCYLEAVMRMARFSAVMCWDMRCGMRVCFAVPI